MVEIVHEIDLCGGLYAHPETSGVDALLRGWQLAGLLDKEMEARGIDLFDGLYAAFGGREPGADECRPSPIAKQPEEIRL